MLCCCVCCVGWACSLSESSFAMMLADRVCCRLCAVCLTGMVEVVCSELLWMWFELVFAL